MRHETEVTKLGWNNCSAVSKITDFKWRSLTASHIHQVKLKICMIRKMIAFPKFQLYRWWQDSDDNYMTVMVRVEHFAINHKFNELPAEARRDKLMECFKNISTKVDGKEISLTHYWPWILVNMEVLSSKKSWRCFEASSPWLFWNDVWQVIDSRQMGANI